MTYQHLREQEGDYKMTTDFDRQAKIYHELNKLYKKIGSLKETVREEALKEMNTSETDLQIDLQNAFDYSLHGIGYDYDQRRW